MDLIDKKDLPLSERCEEGDDIGLFLDGRSARRLEWGSHLMGDDRRYRRLAESGWSIE